MKLKIETKAKRLFISQHGERIYASTVKELRSKVGCGGSKVSKMYVTSKDGKTTKHVGYVIGQYWFSMYAPVYTNA